MNLLDNTPNHPTKFRTKDWVETNDDARGMYNTYSQIKSKRQCESQVYLIIVMRTYFWVGIWQLLYKEQMMLQNKQTKEKKE